MGAATEQTVILWTTFNISDTTDCPKTGLSDCPAGRIIILA